MTLCLHHTLPFQFRETKCRNIVVYNQLLGHNVVSRHILGTIVSHEFQEMETCAIDFESSSMQLRDAPETDIKLMIQRLI